MPNDVKPLKTGDTLRNGATVIECNRTDDARVVLASCSRYGSTEFVTWRLDEDGHSYWGHYFKTEVEARDDFNNRLKG